MAQILEHPALPDGEPELTNQIGSDHTALRADGTAAEATVLDLRNHQHVIVDLRSVGATIEPAGQVETRAEPTVGAVPDTSLRGLLAAKPWQRAAKRGIDVLGGLAVLLILSPLLVLTAAAVVLTSRGPLVYTSVRVGRGGRPFKMLKFRSMYQGAEEDRDHLAHMNEGTGPIFKIREDPRVTTVGRVIRKFSIDELPQLLNVLRGEMSLVGPRPPLPQEVETYSARERQRISVTPGLTCIWQVKGRADLDFDTWVDMDLEYIRTWTLRQDLKLLALTLPAALSGRGAY